MCDRPPRITLTREQAYRLVEAWVAPELWKDRKAEVDALFDAAEGEQQDEVHEP